MMGKLVMDVAILLVIAVNAGIVKGTLAMARSSSLNYAFSQMVFVSWAMSYAFILLPIQGLMLYSGAIEVGLI